MTRRADVVLAGSGLEIIRREECLRLLAGRVVGRLGFLAGDQPMVLPVNYAFVDGVVVFRTAEGSKLDGLANHKVAFEVDEVDPETRTGWSVVVEGEPEDITDDADWFAQRLRDAAAPTWPAGVKDRYVRIRPQVVAGRRIPGTPSG